MPVITPDAGSGSGSGSGSGGVRRLGKFLGGFPGSGSGGRPVFAHTSCPPGPRRLGKYLFDWPAFWASGSGSGGPVYVPSRPVFGYGDCVTRDPAAPCVTVLCCPNPISATLYATFSSSPPCACWDAVPPVPLAYNGLSWDNVTAGGSAFAVCEFRIGSLLLTCGSTGWVLFISSDGGGLCSFDAIGGGHTACHPFSVSFNFRLTGTGGTCATCAGSTLTITVSADPTGGSGSGSGGDPCFGRTASRLRGLGKYVGRLTRGVFAEACCPGIGGGSGGFCDGPDVTLIGACGPFDGLGHQQPVPRCLTFVVARTSAAGTCVPDPDGQEIVVPYTGIGVADIWSVNATIAGVNVTITLFCSGGTWTITITDGVTSFNGTAGESSPGVWTFSIAGIDFGDVGGCVYDLNASFAF